jgi:drug/metabolite transporter (DMT)-like permease
MSESSFDRKRKPVKDETNAGDGPVIAVDARQRGRLEIRFETVKLILAFVAIYFIWGSTYLAIRYAIETFPPLVAASLRHFIAGTFLLAWALARGFRPTRANWVAGLLVGALFFLIGHGTLHWAQQYVSSGLAALVIATEPLFILVLAWLSGRQPINGSSMLGLASGLVGVALLTGAELTTTGTSFLAALAVLASSLSWAVGVVVSPKVALPSNPLGRTAIPLLCGAVELLVVAWITGETRALVWSEISLRSIFGLAYLIVFGSVIAFTSYMWLLQRCPATLVATHTYVNPLVAVLLGWLFAAEKVSAWVILASVAIPGAIMLVRRGERLADATPCHGTENAQGLFRGRHGKS